MIWNRHVLDSVDSSIGPLLNTIVIILSYRNMYEQEVSKVKHWDPDRYTLPVRFQSNTIRSTPYLVDLIPGVKHSDMSLLLEVYIIYPVIYA